MTNATKAVDSDDESEPTLQHIKMYVPAFKRNKLRDFLRWWPLFKAYAMQKGFLSVISRTKHPDLPPVEQMYQNGKPVKSKFNDEQKKALMMNQMGITAFILAFKDNKSEDCISYVNATQTDEWPSGQCHLVVIELLDEYAPEDSMGLVEQKRDLENISMRRGDNPKTLFTQITAIENRYRNRVTPLTEKDKLCQVILRAPAAYQPVIHSTRQLAMQKTNAEPTLKELRQAMYDYYRVAKCKSTPQRELTLFMGDDDDDTSSDDSRPRGKRTKKHYKGKRNNRNKGKRCYGCGEYGHIKRDCPKEKAKRQQTCGHCGKKGHSEADCWDKHPEKRPKWASKKGKKKSKEDEVAAIVVNEELAFASFDDDDEYSILSDCEIVYGEIEVDEDWWDTKAYRRANSNNASSSTTCNVNNLSEDDPHCKVIEEEDTNEDCPSYPDQANATIKESGEESKKVAKLQANAKEFVPRNGDACNDYQSPYLVDGSSMYEESVQQTRGSKVSDERWSQKTPRESGPFNTQAAVKAARKELLRLQRDKVWEDILDRNTIDRHDPIKLQSKSENDQDDNPIRTRRNNRQYRHKKMKEEREMTVRQSIDRHGQVDVDTSKKMAKQQKTGSKKSKQAEMALSYCDTAFDEHRNTRKQGKTPWSCRNRCKRGKQRKQKNNDYTKTRKIREKARCHRGDSRRQNPRGISRERRSNPTAKIRRDCARRVAGKRQPNRYVPPHRRNENIHERRSWTESSRPRVHQRVDRNGWYRSPTDTYRTKNVFNINLIIEKNEPDGQDRPKFVNESWRKIKSSHRRNSPYNLRERAHHEANERCGTNERLFTTFDTFRNDYAIRHQDELFLANLEATLSQTSGTEKLYGPEYWVGDTGASCHCTNSDIGSTPSPGAAERLKSSKASLDASGNSMRTQAIIDIKGTVCNYNGKTRNIKMTDVRFGSSKFNLCSLTKMTDEGWTMTMNKKGIYLRKGKHLLHFDVPIKTSEGRLWAIRILRRSPDCTANELALATPNKMNLERAHAYCGHNNLRDTKRTAKHLGWRITGRPFTRCEACAVAKAKQTNLGKGETNPPRRIGDLWYIDGMSLKRPTRGRRGQRVYFPSNNCMELAVEHLSGCVIMGWFKTKAGFIDPYASQFNYLRETHNKPVKRIRCDDAGENKSFQKVLNGELWQMNTTFEFTAKTPQANSRVETKIYHLCNKTRAALQAANTPNAYRYVLFVLFSRWCGQTENLNVVTVNGVTKTRYEHLYGRLPNWVRHMQVAGTAGVVKTHTKTTPKVDARGKICLFACYATDHTKDCYVMYDPQSRSVLHSRDVLWLNRMYFSPQQTIRDPIHVLGVRTPFEHTEEGSDGIENDGIENEDDESSESSESMKSNIEESDESTNESESDESNMFDEELGTTEDEPTETEATDRTVKYTTRSGRNVRAPVMHDGTERGLIHVEEEITAIAADIEDDFVNETCLLGIDEAYHVSHPHYNPDLCEEEMILFTLMKGEKQYKSVERAFGYRNKKGEYFLVAATLEDEDGELFLVGATGHNYGNTAELNVMTYKQAMATVDREEWEKAVKIEHQKMVKYNVFKVVHPRDIPKGTKLFDSTWAMKKKPDGTFRARNAIRGFMQVDGQHFDSQDKSAPVATEIGIKIVFVLTILAKWYQHLVDVEGAFLNGVFQQPEKHKIYMKVPEAYKRWYPSWAVLLLMKTQYGTIQAALQYYRECCKALEFLRFKRNEAEPCMFYKWMKGQLVIFLLWVDDCCVCGPKELVKETVKEFTALWDCKDIGELKEYVGCKVERTAEWIRLTQPVKVQRFIDEFGCKGEHGPSNRAPTTPAEPGSVLEYDKETEPGISEKKQTKYRSAVGILLHMMRWSRPDTLNAVRELSSYMQKAGKQCLKALARVMNFIVATRLLGLMFKPKGPGGWDGRIDTHIFTVMGKCDSEFAKHKSRRSVNAGITYLDNAIVKQFSKMMPIVALSTTEAELYSAVLTAQDMMFVYHILGNMGLKVKTPMILYCDNKGAVDLANNWSVGGRTRHTGTKMNFLRELKDNGILNVVWRSGKDITPDMHTKNVTRKLFQHYSQELVG